MIMKCLVASLKVHKKRNEEHVTKKRGRPQKKTDGNKTWAEDETTTLIDVWAHTKIVQHKA